MKRSSVQYVFAWLLLLSLMIAGAAWQHRSRADQVIVVGGDLDDGAVHNFQGRERSPFLGDTPFRWSKPAAQLRFWGSVPGAPAALSLRMIAPERSGFTQQITLTSDAAPLGSFPVATQLRAYRLLLPPAPTAGDRVVDLASRPFPGDDARPLGVVLTGARLASLEAQPWPGALAELWQLPFLPLTLALIGLCARWAGGARRWPLIALLPALALGALALLDRVIPNVALLLATYALGLTLAIVAGLAAVAILRRFPQLRPDDDRRAQRWIALAFLIAMAFTFSPSMRSDGVGYYVYLRSLTMDGDLSFENDYNALWPNYTPSDVSMVQPTGYTGNPWSVGPAFWWSPLFGIAHVIVLAGQALGAPWRADGYGEHYIALITLGSALAGLGALLVCYRISRRWVAPPAAALAVIALLYGSNLLYYMTRRGCYAHALGALLASLFVLAWLRLEERPSVGRWAIVGVAAGLMLQTYWVSGLTFLLALMTGARLLWAALRGPRGEAAHKIRELLLGGAAAGAIALLLFVPQMVAWQVIYGAPLTVPQGSGFVTPGSSRILAMLAGQPYGLLWWTPTLFLGVAGLALLWRRAPWLAACLLLALALYFWYNSTIRDWHGSGGFGLRRLSLLAPWCAIGLALLYERLARVSAVLPVGISVLSGAWVLMLLVRLDHDLIPFQAEELAARPFVELFISRNALPLWDVPRLLAGSYYADQIRALPNPFAGLWLALLLAITGLSTWAVTRVLRWQGDSPPGPRQGQREQRRGLRIPAMREAPEGREAGA